MRRRWMGNERQSAFSGRLPIAQQFTAGTVMGFVTKSVKRTTEKLLWAANIQPPAQRGLISLAFKGY